MRKLFIDCLGSCLPSVFTQEQQAGNVVDENVSWLRSGHVRTMAIGWASKNMKNVKIQIEPEISMKGNLRLQLLSALKALLMSFQTTKVTNPQHLIFIIINMVVVHFIGTG